MTQDQVNALIRYAGVAVGGAVTYGGLLAVLPADTVAHLTPLVQKTATDTTALISDLWSIGVVIGPFVALWLARIGVKSASDKAQIAKVQAMPEAQVQVTDPKLAEGIPGVQVVSK